MRLGSVENNLGFSGILVPFTQAKEKSKADGIKKKKKTK